MADAESAADYVRRVWSVYPQVAESFDVGLAWNDLSEWLHGRGQVTAALGEIADAASLAGPGALSAMTGVHERVSALAEVVLRQVRGGVTLLAEEHYGDKFTAALQMTRRPNKTDETESPHLAPLLDALDFQAAFGEKGQGAIRWAIPYRVFVGHPAAADMLAVGTSPGLAAGAMLERRGRGLGRGRGAAPPRGRAATLWRATAARQLSGLHEARGTRRATR